MYLDNLGPTWFWISLLAFPPPKVILLFWLLWIIFLRLLTSCPYPSSALETTQLLINHVIRIYGIPVDIVSNQGPHFVSQVWKAFCNTLSATVSLSSGHHPQSNGQTEHWHQDLEAALRCVTCNNPSTWSQHLIWVEYAHNTHTSSSTGLAFKVWLGYNPPLFLSVECSVPCVLYHLRRCRPIWRQTKEAQLKTVEQNKKMADRHGSSPYQVSQRVWHYTKDIQLKDTSKKLSPFFIRPPCGASNQLICSTSDFD